MPENSVFSGIFRERRRRDSNPRDAFDAYTISSRAPSTKLGDFSIFSFRFGEGQSPDESTSVIITRRQCECNSHEEK